MNLPTEIFGDVIVVHTPEELGADQAESFEAFMVNLERRNAVLDLDRTETLDSQGLTAILDTRDNLVELGGGRQAGHHEFDQPKDPGNHPLGPADRDLR